MVKHYFGKGGKREEEEEWVGVCIIVTVTCRQLLNGGSVEVTGTSLDPTIKVNSSSLAVLLIT